MPVGPFGIDPVVWAVLRLVIAVGGAVGFVAISVILPMYSLLKAVK